VRQWVMGVMVGALVGGLMGALVVLLVAPRGVQAAPDVQTQTIRDLVVQRLRVVDVEGRVRGTFEVRGSEATLALNNSDAINTMKLTVDDNRALVQVNDPRLPAGEGGRDAVLGVNSDGPYVGVRNTAIGRINMGISAQRGPELDISDRDFRPLWSAP
jgi:hypothetical protein